MPEIIPIRDLKNTNAISQRCHETQEPIFATKSGYGNMVIMSIRAPRMLSGEFLFMATPHNSRLTMRVPQPDIIEHFGNADAVPQPPERCLELCGIAFIISALIGCKTAKRATALTDCGPTYYFMRCGY